MWLVVIYLFTETPYFLMTMYITVMSITPAYPLDINVTSELLAYQTLVYYCSIIFASYSFGSLFFVNLFTNKLFQREIKAMLA